MILLRKTLRVEDAQLIAKALKMCNRGFRQITMDYMDRALQDTPHKVFFDTASKLITEDVDMYASAAEKYTTQGYRKGWKEGRAEGKAEDLAQGAVQGKADMLVLLLSQRFSTVSEAIRNRVRSADGNTLDTWALRVQPAKTIEDVFAE